MKDRKILFLKRSEDSENFPGWLMLPGGKQEEYETPLQTAIRETFEETGIKAINSKLKVIATHNHFYRETVYLVYIFVANEFSRESEESEEGKPVWINLDKAMNNPKLYPDLKRHIRMVTECESDNIIFTYHKFNKNLEIIEKV